MCAETRKREVMYARVAQRDEQGAERHMLGPLEVEEAEPNALRLRPSGWTWLTCAALVLGCYQTAAAFVQTPDSKQPVPVAISMLLMESLKFLASFVRLTADGPERACGQVNNLKLWQLMPYAVPGAARVLTRGLESSALLFMDPASYHMLSNGKIIVTALLFRSVLKRELIAQHWLALLLLCVAAVAAQPAGHVAYLAVAPVGLAILVAYCSLSGAAGVGYEWAMKHGSGATHSIHLQNCIVFGWGLVFHGLHAAATHQPTSGGAMDGINGFASASQTGWWVLYVLSGALFGVLLSFVMKYLSSIHSLFVGVAAVLLSQLLQTLLLGAPLEPVVWVGATGALSGGLWLFTAPAEQTDTFPL